MEREFKIFLRELWGKLVSHVVNVLQATCHCNSTHLMVPYSRPLSLATPCRRCSIQRAPKGCLGRLRSYTTTLTALIRARRPGLLESAHDKKRIIAIGQLVAKDASQLIHMGTELDNIDRLVNGLATFVRIEGQDACMHNVSELGRNE